MIEPTDKPTKEEWPEWATDCFYCDKNNVWAFKDGKGLVRNIKGKFIPGYKGGNPDGISSNHAVLIQKIRSMSLKALEDKGLPRIIKHLDKKSLTTKDLVSLVRVLAEIGLPKQSEEVGDIGAKLPQIVISREAFERAEELDKQYREQESEEAE